MRTETNTPRNQDTAAEEEEEGEQRHLLTTDDGSADTVPLLRYSRRGNLLSNEALHFPVQEYLLKHLRYLPITVLTN